MRAAFAVLCLAATGCNAVLGVDPGTLDKGMIHIEGEPFTFSLTINFGSGTPVTTPDVKSELSHAFALDEDEVTVGRFQAWLDAGSKTPADGETLDPGGPYAKTMVWNNDFDADAGDQMFAAGCQRFVKYTPDTTTYERGDPALPMACVKWAQAAAFCAFEHKRLPSNVEWQYAAQGGTDRTAAPFAGEPTCDKAIVDVAGTGSKYCKFPVPVGTASVTSKDGLLDMGGSLTEWVWDGYDTSGARKPLPSTLADGAAGDAGHFVNRLLRGAQFYASPADALKQNENALAGDNSAVSDVGFRCAKTLFLAE